MDLTNILWGLFLITFLFWTGLETPKGEIACLLHERGFMLRALLAEVVLVPILGFVLAEAFQLSGQFRTGFLLVACLPGGMMALNFVRMARGNMPLAAGLVFILNALGILVAPPVARFFFKEAGLRQPGLIAILLLFVLVAVPFYFGRIARTRGEKIVLPLGKVLNIASLLLFVAANVSAVSVRGPAIRGLDGSMVVAIILLVAGAWVISWSLSGRDLPEKKTVSITTSMRNFAIALLLCRNLPAESSVVGAIIAFNGIAVPMNMLFGLVLHWIGRPAAGRIQPRTA